MIRKALAWLLTLMMVVSILPMSVFATEEATADDSAIIIGDNVTIIENEEEEPADEIMAEATEEPFVITYNNGTGITIGTNENSTLSEALGWFYTLMSMTTTEVYSVEITINGDITDTAVAELKYDTTITGTGTLTNVQLNAVEGCDALTVSGLTFTGNSWINSGAAETLVVSGVTANVTPSNAAYTNSRSAFISLGGREAQQLDLTVENCDISVKSNGANPILGWAAITKATITGNTIDSQSGYTAYSDSIKFMSIADGATFNFTGNTVCSDYNGIVLGQNTTRDNAYTATFTDNTFIGGADHIWIEVSGSNTCKGNVNVSSNNTVNRNTFTAADIKLHNNLSTFTGYMGVDVETDADGKVIAGTLAKYGENVIADGYELGADGKVVVVAPAYVAKIGSEEYMSLADALTAASALTGDVTVEILDKVTLNNALSGSYDSIKFVGMNTDAEIYLEVQGYITATGKNVAFEDLKLSKSAGGFITNAGFMNVAFGVYDVVKVTYTNCTFANGAYASSGDVTFTDCTFGTSYDKYGLWAYGDVNATVTGCKFVGERAIKMYAEDSAKTTELAVSNSDFSQTTGGKPDIILSIGKSLTLSNNTYSGNGVLRLESTSAGTAVTSNQPITCIDDATGNACGVLVDGKIYTTVAQAAAVATSGSKVTLLHDSAETVKLPEGVILDKNGFEAAGVTVAQPATPVAYIGETPYTSLQAAINAAAATDTIVVMQDVKENITSLKGNIVSGVAEGVTITSDYESWVYCGNDFTIGEGVTFKTAYMFAYCKNGVINGTVELSAQLYMRYAGAKLTINAPGKLIITGENAIIRYMEGDIEAGIYINGDNDDSTVEFKAPYISFYSGIISAKDAVIETGVLWQTNSTDSAEHGAAYLKLDNSKLNMTVYEHTFKADDNSKIELINGSAMNIAGNYQVADTVELVVDATSSIKAKNYTYVHPVAKIGETKYESLEDAFAAAVDGATITLLADATPVLKSQSAITKASVIDLGGKTLTLTEDDLYFGTTTFKNGTIVVDPSVKASTAVFWMFKDQTLTFDNVKIVATGVSGTYLIGLDGNNSDLNLLNGSEILVENTTALDLDIICVNASTGNDIVIDNSKVNVTNLDGRVFFRGNYTVKGESEIVLEGITKAGFRIEAGQTLSIEDTSEVTITGEPRDGGIHLTDTTATYTKADTATVNATVNKPTVAQIGDTPYESLADALAALQAGDEIVLLADVAEDITVPAGVIFNGNGKQVGTIKAAGEITFKGHTKATNFGTQYTNTTINIIEGACLEITGTGRMIIGHGCTFNITGNITDAKTADKATLTPSLVVAAGASFTGTGLNFNVTNAYVKFNGNSTSKNSNANGTFNFNVTNSIWEQTGVLAFYVPTSGMDPTFNLNLKDSVLTTTSHLIFGISKGEIVIDNSNVNVGKSCQLENRSTMTIKNGSVVNGTVATSSNAINPGIIIVENATYAVTGQFSGSTVGTGTLIIKKGANVSVGSIVDNANIVIDATDMIAGDVIDFTANLSKFAGTIEVVNNNKLEAKIVDGKIVLAAKPVAKIGDTPYTTLEDAFKAATEGCTIEILADVTVDGKWDCRDYATNGSHSQFKETVTINGNGHTIKFTGTISDGNWNTIFRFEEDATVTNLTIDISEATGAQRVISAKKSLTVDGLTIIGSVRYGIIFGEGSSAVDLAATEIVIKNSTLTGTRRAISDNEGGKDVKSVVVTGNTLNANVAVSASESIIFNNNTAAGEVDLRSYSAENVLSVEAKGNALNPAAKNYIYAKTIDAQDEFTTKNPPIKVSTKAELNAALAAAKDGDTIVLTADIDYGTDQLAITKAITLDLGGKTLTTRNAWGGMSVKGNPTIKNGTIVHASNTAAIKVWNATAFENLVIDVQGKGDANKTIGGIVLQSGSTTRVGSIKNVTIKGAALTNGIETYNCGDAAENVIGSLENVNIDANGTAMLISAPVGTATGCTFDGGVNGVELWIKGNYSASLTLADCDVVGGVSVHDEYATNVTNAGTLTLTVDEATTGVTAETVTLTINHAEETQVKGEVLETIIEKAQAKLNGTYYETLADAIKAAKAGDTVTVFEGTYAVPSMKAGITIVGEGNVVFEGTLTGTLENLTLKNIHIKGSNAQRWAYAKGDLVFENVTFEATSVYAIHFDGIAAGTNLTYKDCTIIGWAAMGGSPASCVFDGCTIKGNGTYGVIRTYFDATINECTFDVANVNTTDNYQDGIHAVDGAKVTVNNCTNVNGDMIDVVNVSGSSVVVLDGVEIKNVAKIGGTYYQTLADAIKAAKAGDTVTVFEGTYAIPSMKAGITIVGEGNVLFEGTLSGTLENLTLKNIHIKDGNAQRWAYAKGDLVFENVTFEATSVYALHFDGIAAGTNLTYKDCTIIGWAAMGGSPESCVFDGCTIKDNGTYGVIRTYFGATIKNCTFDVKNANTNDAYEDGIHAVDGAVVTVENCTNANGDMKDLVNVHANSVVVLDGKKIQNVAKIGDTYYKTLSEAIAAAKAGEIVTVFEGTYAVPSMKAGITIVGEGNVVFEGTLSGTLENLTLKNIHIKGGNAQRWAYAKGNLAFENVTFEATSTYALHFDGITAGATLAYKNCTIIGWAAMSGSPASCVFEGCTFKGNGTYGVIRTYFDATIENCTFDVANVNTTDNYQDGIHAVEGAKVTVNNCTNVNGDMKDLVNVHANSVVVLDGVEIRNVAKIGDKYYTTCAEAFAKAVAGDTITLLADITATEVILIDKSLTINGNGHKVTSSASRVFRVTTADVDVTLNGVNMVSTAVRVGTNDIRGISIDIVDNVKLTLNNCSVDFTDATANDWAYAVNVTGGSNHTLTVNGGTYEGANVINVRGANNIVVVKDATLNCTYPNNDMYAGACIWVLQNQGSSVEATGNTFNGSNAVAFNLGTGTTLTESNNVDNTTKVVAKIGDTYYTSLQDAVNAATDGATITVLASHELVWDGKTKIDGTMAAMVVVAGKSVTIDLNGKALTVDGAKMNGTDLYAVFASDEGGKLTLNDTVGGASVKATGVGFKASVTAYCLMMAYEGGTSLTVNGGYYYMEAAHDSLVYAGGGKEIVVINGGTFILGNVGDGQNGKPWIFNTLGQNERSILVNGGTFNADINHQYWIHEVKVADDKALVNNGDGTWSIDKAVAYVVEKTSDGYTHNVGYKTLAEAVAATKNGETIVLVTDIALDAAITVAKNVTLDLNGKTISRTHGTEYAMIHVANGAELTIKDSSDAKTGKITYVAGGNNTGAAVHVEGALVLESGTIEVTGSWSFGFAVDLRPNAWGTAHTVGASFIMNGGTVKSSDTAVRVASNSSDAHPELGVTFTMNGGTIESTWDAIFVQHLYAGDLNVNVVDGTVTGANSAMRIYGNAGSDIDMIVTGGTFSGAIKVADAYVNTDAIAISGGNFNVNPSAYVVDGYEAVETNGTWTVEEAEEKFDITSSSIVLGNELAMYFYVPKADLNGTDYVAVITKSYADGREDLVVEIPYSEWEETSNNRMRFKFDGIAAKEMADNICAVIKNATTNEVVTNEYNDSIRGYIERGFETGNAQKNAELATMLVDMLNYGAAAQQMFTYATDDLANKNMGAYQDQYATKNIDLVNSQNKGTGYKSASLTLKSDILVTMLFYKTNVTQDMTAVVTFTDHYGKAHEIRVTGDKFTDRGNVWGIVVDELVVADASQIITCTFEDASGNVIDGVYGEDSIESICARAVAGGGGTYYEDIMKFAKAAYNYFN